MRSFGCGDRGRRGVNGATQRRMSSTESGWPVASSGMTTPNVPSRAVTGRGCPCPGSRSGRALLTSSASRARPVMVIFARSGRRFLSVSYSVMSHHLTGLDAVHQHLSGGRRRCCWGFGRTSAGRSVSAGRQRLQQASRYRRQAAQGVKFTNYGWIPGTCLVLTVLQVRPAMSSCDHGFVGQVPPVDVPGRRGVRFTGG